VYFSPIKTYKADKKGKTHRRDRVNIRTRLRFAEDIGIITPGIKKTLY
jgi:hypothetical protein